MIPTLINYLLKILKIKIIFRDGYALGDQICLTALLEFIKERNINKIIIFSPYPEIFFNNPFVFKCFKIDNSLIKRLLIRILYYSKGKSIIEYRTALRDENQKYFASKVSNPYHLSLLHGEQLIDFRSDVKIKCNFYFSDKENKIFNEKFKKILGKKFAIIQSETSKKMTSVKNWEIEKFQKIVDSTYETINWIQIGKNEYKLNNTTDLTKISVREMIYLIKHSNFILCLESVYNHIASAFNKKVFLIASGFIPIEFFKYENSQIIKPEKKVNCDPCFILGSCPIDSKPCTSQISSKDVLNIIYKYIK